MDTRALSDLLERRPIIGDAVLALAVLLVVVPIDGGNAVDLRQQWWWYLWAAGFAIPLIWRRSRPQLAAGLLLVPHLIQLALGVPATANLVVPLVLHSVASRGRGRWPVVWLGVGLVGALLAGLSWGRGTGEAGRIDPTLAAVITAACAGSVLAAWFLGRLSRERHHSFLALQQRAAALERERDQGLRLAASEERSRIAREMHDLIAHALSVIIVQTDGARYVMDSQADPQTRLDAAQRTLATIGDSARSALADTRRLVGVLREPGSVEYSPRSGLDDLPELVASLAESGVEVALLSEGAPGEAGRLGAGAELALYRIVQEALTNVLRHAGPNARAEVRLRRTRRAVEVEVVDDGRGSLGVPSSEAGHGLIGMRERVSAFDGRLETGNRPGGGFRVWATIPVQEGKP
ncbi:sensor histidine kinase [Naumannella sp. ID2617S]|nr:sensor histidine kinase [Naumannella sp. ID2617S]